MDVLVSDIPSNFFCDHMSISEKDIKKLWGLAAGRCSKPGCEDACIKFLDNETPTVTGEMAHKIAKKPDGPRGIPEGGDDSYKNLILLCPTHHTEIDKAPEGTFSAELLEDWKRLHESRVVESFLSPKFSSLSEMARAIVVLLTENKSLWAQYGPESAEADKNPLSSAYEIWNLRKLDTLIPNNRRIIQIIQQNKDIIPLDDYEVFMSFKTHAEGFERSAYVKSEGVPRFPGRFGEIVNEYARL